MIALIGIFVSLGWKLKKIVYFKANSDSIHTFGP
jgi:hypothetical protein